jgi:membrane fusion protein (multidrug efflux system)
MPDSNPLTGTDRPATQTGGPGDPQATDTEPRKPAKRRWLRRFVVLAVLLAAAWGGFEYWHYRSLHPQTSDAYLNAHVVRIAPQIAGQVLRVLVSDQQHVGKGQLLLEIDPAPFEIAVEQAEAQLNLAKQDVAAAEAAVEAAHAEVTRQEVTLKNVTKNTTRTLALVTKGTLPKARGDDARAALKEAQAALTASKADLQRALSERGTEGQQNARVRAAAAAVAKARLNLSYTKVSAPAAGIVGEIGIRPGASVDTRQALFPLVEDNSFWVDANYKETDLERIKPGETATISVDTYSDKTFRGTVLSVSPASGAAFSLLPPENATGNWVKVTQRFPVRVSILDADPSHPLRKGASCAVTIDTTSHAG